MTAHSEEKGSGAKLCWDPYLVVVVVFHGSEMLGLSAAGHSQPGQPAQLTGECAQ